jgi:predicted GNAT superfamily acetyltransferase
MGIGVHVERGDAGERESAHLPAGITIEQVRTSARFGEIEELQLRVWDMDARGVVPATIMQIIVSSGGLLLAAYAGERPVGFVLGLLARRDGRLYHASHMLATDPDYQGRGIGEALKRRQRAHVLAQGIDLMTWTFDPLIARNAYFNLHKLGATSRIYHEDYYGPMQDRYNKDLPTDRLLVEWHLRDPIGPSSNPPSIAPPVPLLLNVDGRPVLAEVDGKPVPIEMDGRPSAGGNPPTELGRAPLTIQIPRDVTELHETDPALLLAWRLAVRQALIHALKQGYRVHDFINGAYLLVPLEDAAP